MRADSLLVLRDRAQRCGSGHALGQLRLSLNLVDGRAVEFVPRVGAGLPQQSPYFPFWCIHEIRCGTDTELVEQRLAVAADTGNVAHTDVLQEIVNAPAR